MKFSSFLCILLGVKMIGIGIGVIIGYYLYDRAFAYHYLYLTIPKRKKKTIKAVIEYDGPIETPIKKGEKLGILNVYVSGELDKQINILSAEDIKRSNIFSRILRSLNYMVWGDV